MTTPCKTNKEIVLNRFISFLRRKYKDSLDSWSVPYLYISCLDEDLKEFITHEQSKNKLNRPKKGQE